MRNIRINLNDIIDSKVEDVFMYNLYEIEKKSKIDKIIFWMYSFSEESVKKFMEKHYNSNNNKKINFLFTPKYPSEEFAWFDIIDKKYHADCQNRFSYVYQDNKNMVLGLHNFYNVSSFVDNSMTYKKIQYVK